MNDDVTEADLGHLRRAIGLAKKARENGNMPFGAVIVAADGRVAAEAENSTVTDKDIASHAEINAIRRVCADDAPSSLAGATIYTNTEPCPMCLGAIIRYGLGRIVYAARWADFSSGLPSHSVAYGASLARMAESADHPLVIQGPLLEAEAGSVPADVDAANGRTRNPSGTQ